ncbi:MAG: hypothetical protein Q8O30_06340 [Candidatus Omnitrophota bacterium]|nr:hypothetical protein [Candidatus Omnitrophota bacterium]
MSKKQLIVCLLVLSLIPCSAFIAKVIYAEEQQQVDWDKIEKALYEELKATSDKSDAEIHQAIGYSLLRSENQWERATVHFKKAVGLDPKLYFSWYNLGMINADTEEGYNYFKKATEAKPDFPSSYYWMAYYRCRNREDKKAIPLFQKYIEVAKGDKQEAGRIGVAEEVLQDLLAGKEGKSLSMMRRPSEGE